MSGETRKFRIYELDPEECYEQSELPERAMQIRESSPTRQYTRKQPAYQHQTEQRYQQRAFPAPARRKANRQPHWLFYVGFAIFVMAAGTALILWVVGMVGDLHDNMVYGMPRTQTVSQVVGHGDSAAHPSIFIARNISQQAVVQECPGGDMTHCTNIILPIGLTGAGSDKIPVTMTFKDVNRDGKVDLIVTVNFKQQPQIFVYLNTGKSFRPATPKDTIAIGDLS